MQPNKAQLCQHYIDIIYNKILIADSVNGHDVTQANGEILASSMNLLLSKLSLTEDDIFFDLGSGSGKLVLQVFLQTNVKECVGIEVSSALYQQSVCALNQIQQELPLFFADNRKISFVRGDFFETSFAKATILLINSTCFSQAMLIKLSSLINQQTAIRYVLTLRPLYNLKNMKLVKIIRVQCSWDVALCYIYEALLPNNCRPEKCYRDIR